MRRGRLGAAYQLCRVLRDEECAEGNRMTDGLVFVILVFLPGLLMLIGIISNASISRDEERRHR